ncbi:unnamed protein product [Soboliphyme baturini]|uniref:Inactive tyrosine-protein kinase 7 n=1 Tax=Soboliphyme baturini TaxID=241478 RepID=A0A183IVG3_9BILA|nr:unnamed protein product [Soboliphyme baturini]
MAHAPAGRQMFLYSFTIAASIVKAERRSLLVNVPSRGSSFDTCPSLQANHCLLPGISQNASVEVMSPSFEVLESGNVTDIELHCVADGFDEPLYRWFHNANRLKKTDRVIPRQRRLVVKDVSIEDNGVYSCEAENAAGTVRSQSNFILSIPGSLPKIKLLSSNKVVRLGSTVSLDCAFEDASEVRWKRPGHDAYYPRASENERIASLNSNNSLVIKDIQSSDAGYYECFGFLHGASSAQSYAVAVNIATLEDFRSSSFEPVRDIYIVGQGKRFEVACVPPHGYPTPFVYWSKAGKALESEGRIRATTDYSLIIDSARPDDKGSYDCIAENVAGVKKGTLYIHVSRAPQMERHPSSLEVEEGSDARFDCTFKGNEYPVTFVEWEKNGEPFTLHTRDARYQVFHHNGTLKITSTSLSDEGEYTCVVKTADQRPLYSQPARLNVRERLKFTPKPVHKKLELNSDAQIPCKASGHIPATVKWLRTGNISIDGVVHKYKQPVTDFGQNIRDKDGILYFHKAKFEYAGLYMCVAVSSQGVINETIKVEVFVAPVFDRVSKNMTVEEDEPAWMHCVVRGTPHPTVHWKFRYRKFLNNTLHLPNVNVDLAGKYVCMAGNKGGFKRHEALLCVKCKLFAQYFNSIL